VSSEGATSLGRARLFLGVGLDEETRSIVAAHVANLDPPVPGRVVAPANWHLTLRFLGWTGDVERDRILANIDTSDLGDAFRIRFGGLGAFPKAGRATVIWIGVDDGAERLAALAEACNEAAVAVGFSPEERPYHPHLTLSRVRPPVDARALIDAAPPLDLAMGVGTITLFESHLRRGGAQYEPLETIAL
jgi:2'-5' RNA ligase